MKSGRAASTPPLHSGAFPAPSALWGTQLSGRSPGGCEAAPGTPIPPRASGSSSHYHLCPPKWGPSLPAPAPPPQCRPHACLIHTPSWPQSSCTWGGQVASGPAVASSEPRARREAGLGLASRTGRVTGGQTALAPGLSGDTAQAALAGAGAVATGTCGGQAGLRQGHGPCSSPSPPWGQSPRPTPQHLWGLVISSSTTRDGQSGPEATGVKGPSRLLPRGKGGERRAAPRWREGADGVYPQRRAGGSVSGGGTGLGPDSQRHRPFLGEASGDPRPALQDPGPRSLDSRAAGPGTMTGSWGSGERSGACEPAEAAGQADSSVGARCSGAERALDETQRAGPEGSLPPASCGAGGPSPARPLPGPAAAPLALRPQVSPRPVPASRCPSLCHPRHVPGGTARPDLALPTASHHQARGTPGGSARRPGVCDVREARARELPSPSPARWAHPGDSQS